MACSCSSLIKLQLLSSHQSNVATPPTNLSSTVVHPRLRSNRNERICKSVVAHGCCGGGGSGHGNGSCSSHEKPSDDPKLSGVGKEFQQMVAIATLADFEKQYNTQEMQGTISREVIREVMNTGPAANIHLRGQSVIDLEAMLAEEEASASKPSDNEYDNSGILFV